MAAEQRVLKQDGYLEVGTSEFNTGRGISSNASSANSASSREVHEIPIETRNIVYHPHLNVILVFDSNSQVKVLDVHSGVILQSYQLANDIDCKLYGRFMPLQEKILITDGQNIGFRGDYNGVLLLDTILQSPITQNDDIVRLEMLLSEAVIFQACLKDLEHEGLECPNDVSNELMEKIKNAQTNAKKGIKAQRWNAICMEVPYSSLKLVANNVVIILKRLERHIPVLAIASAINERLTDLLVGSRIPDINWHCNNIQRVLMHSEAVRRQTFEKWPHMDYKWALPDQMAQAGFYHQPSSSGEDRAMCFTCNVCLVCWEKTDEPWSEHERHSPMCPFVKGEYTQNVPLSVTYATNPAVRTAGILGFDVISNSDYANVLCTSCSHTGDVTIWSIERHLKQMHCFNIATLMKDIIGNSGNSNIEECENNFEWVRVTAICVLPNARAQGRLYAMSAAQNLAGNGGGGVNVSNAPPITPCTSTSTMRAGVVGSKLVLGLSTRHTSGEHLLRMVVLNIVESERSTETVGSGDGVITELNNQKSVTGSGIGGGDGTAGENRDDNKSHTSTMFEKYADSFDSNGFVPMSKKTNTGAGASGDKSDAAIEYIDFEENFKKINHFCELTVFNLIENNADTSVSGGGGGGGSSIPSDDTEMEVSYIKKKWMESMSANKQKNNYVSVNNNNQNSGNHASMDANASKLVVNDEIDCVVESCTILKRMNALTDDDTFGRQQDLVEIDEIMPTNGFCNQLLVKLVKMKAPKEGTNKIIMANVENDNDDYQMEDDKCQDQIGCSTIGCQLLLFDCLDGIIPNEHKSALSFSRTKCPQQLCVLPNFPLLGAVESTGNQVVCQTYGALCVVCLDGTIEIYSLQDFQCITTIKEQEQHFIAVAYCRSLERLCCCTRRGTLIFYSLNDADNESGDEMLDADDESNIKIGIQECKSLECGELSVTDGGKKQLLQQHQNEPSNESQTHLHNVTSIKVDCSPSGSNAHCSAVQSSPSPSSSSMNAAATNLLAYRTGDLNLDDLRTLYSLTLFDENLTMYAAEVPSCWNDLVQAQKQRKQTQHMRGEDTQFTKTWRLHNDTTTWDEHIIELNLLQPVSLGHIDLKFTLYQQCNNPAAIQVTLLKQNTSGFGYRMKGQHSSFKHQLMEDENVDAPLGNLDGTNENPVLNEEYLQTHNAEILAGPMELSSCMDLGEQSGTVTLTSPKLFKTRTRNFLLHIKTMADPSKEVPSKNRVPVRKGGIMRLLSSSFANNLSSASHCFVFKNQSNNTTKVNPSSTTSFSATTTTTTSTTATSFPTNTSSKQARYDFYIGCDWLHEISIYVRGVKLQNKIPNERLQRIAMLESNQLLENLFKIVSEEHSSNLAKNLSLDILIWICCIRLKRYRSPKSERIKTQITKQTAANYTDLLAQQFECICLTEKYLEDTLRQCIIRGDRSLAHKCLKLVVLLTDGICNLPTEIQAHTTLDVAMRDAIANTFNELPLAKYASVVSWYATLTWVTSTLKCYHGIPELCIKLLTEISQEMNKRWDPYGALLGTRFGLYGFPFEPEIFDYDLTNVNKNNVNFSSILTTIIRTNAGVFHAGGIDLKKLSSIDGVDLRTFPQLIRCKSVSNQLRGLLEVEQLHFTCTASSEATRIDNMDTVSANSSSNINMEDLVAAPMLSNLVDLSNTEEVMLHSVNDLLNNVKNNVNKLVEKLKWDKSKKMELEKVELKPNGIGPVDVTLISGTESSNSAPEEKIKTKYTNNLPKIKFIYEGGKQTNANVMPSGANTSDGNKLETIQSVDPNGVSNGDNSNNNCNNVFAWHKLLTPPPKQMVIIDRMHSGARRYVVLDFGSPVLLTDLFIPSCDDLASLHIDIWCFDEETDSVRLVVAPDIGTKTLVLSDLQPPPICRYMKITIMGRIGMSSTKCKIPIGSFFGHVIVLESDGYADPLLNYMKYPPQNIQAQIKALTSLYEDVHCRYSLASCKLLDLLTPLLNSEMTNAAHMQAFINKQRDDDVTILDNSKITCIYEECIMLQHQIYVIQNVINRLEVSLQIASPVPPISTMQALQVASRDKLRVLGQTLVEMLLNFSIEYNFKDMTSLHQYFTMEVANMLFDTLVVYGDAHIQLATCSLLVRTCCFQNWWGDFLADIFCKLFSSQNTKIFPQDRIFFMLTYLGRRSIAMGTCRSIVIDAILKTLAKLLAPISPHYQEASEVGLYPVNNESSSGGLWSKSDLQLISWLLLFLSVCLDDSNDRKDKSVNRWEFMSCDSEFSKPRTQSSNGGGKQLRCFKKRIVQQSKYSLQPYTDWGKKIYMIQNEHPGIFMELTGKPKPANKSNRNVLLPKLSKDTIQECENNFDKGLKTIRLNNILIVIRGLVALLLEMDFTCNMDQFLLTSKVIARLVSACRPAVQLSKIITINQLEQLIRLAVWNDQHQPWAVHAITCLLQDLLDADKHFKDNDTTPTNDTVRPMEGMHETKDLFVDYTSPYLSQPLTSSQINSNDVQYTDGVKYPYLPSLIECEDTEFDEILNDIDITERSKPVARKENSNNKNTFNFFCKSLSGAMDARLDIGLNLHVEMDLRRITVVSSLDMFSSLPQIMTNDVITNAAEATIWPEYLTNIWSGPEYNCGLNTYNMFKNVFDCILSDLHLQETWVHLEQVLQMWLTLNGELADKSFNTGITNADVPKIPFGANAVQGLLLALAWHNDVKLRTWCLGFQCLLLACNSQFIGEEEVADTTRINEVIINDENFEKMLLRFFSGYGMSSAIITNRCAGPTICKHLHELLHWLHRKGETNDDVISCKRKLKDTLLHVVLQLIQPGGAISNQLGPIDAQSQLVRDLLTMPNDKADLNVSLHIIECVSFLVFNNISNGDKLQCQRISDANNASNTFSSLFANVLGSDHAKHNTSISDNSLIISLLKLCSSLIQTELPRQLSDVTIPEEEELSTESQTDEIKAEQLNIEGHRIKTPCIADTVLRHFPTMKRLLGSLSHCSSNSFTLMVSSALYSVKPTDSNFFLEEPQTTADAVFNMLITLCEKVSNSRLIVAPICQYLESSIQHRNALPRLHLSEPLLWYISKVLEVPSAVQIFTQLGGIKIICKNLVNLNKSLINMQPGLISLIMQHITRDTKLKMVFHTSSNNNVKKNSGGSAQAQRHLKDGLINFAPFCAISAENETAQSADVLISNPVATHRRPRTPAWSYMFYPNESHADLTITLPTAILLREVQLQPHAPTLASCPSAVALEISRDFGLGPVPVGPPLTTTGMTCIRLKLAKPEIATSVILRLYRPKDSPSIGLTQIAVLGNTIFGSTATGSAVSSGSAGTINPTNFNFESSVDDDTFAKTSVGWVRILSRCFTAASLTPPDSKLAADVIGASAAYPGFLEACCSLMNIMPMIPNSTVQNLETVLLKLGAYSRDLCLSLIHVLLWGTTPQAYKLSNDSICDLLYNLCTAKDIYTLDKVQVLLEWIVKLRQNYSTNIVRCNNPQSGFIKCIASILWHVHAEGQANLQEYLTSDIFDACVYWIDCLANEEPLKISFDTLICSLCFIKPPLFDRLLQKWNVILPQTEMKTTEDIEMQLKSGLTDDSKEASGSVWFANSVDRLSTLLQRPSHLATIAIACQSPNVVYQLVDSDLPKLLAYALYEYCSTLNAIEQQSQPQPQPQPQAVELPAVHFQMFNDCLTDADKVAEDNIESMQTDVENAYQPPLLKSHLVPKILDFFSECCAEGHMRDWLGTKQGSIFWKSLLTLLCNRRSLEFANNGGAQNTPMEPLQQTFIRIERATINFFTRVTTCHPKNQDILTMLLIEVIQQPPPISSMPFNDRSSKVAISGFTRQFVLQLLLENERILVSVRSKQPLQKRDPYAAALPSSGPLQSNSTVASNGVSMALVNHHPSKRISTHHLLFSVSTNSKCQDILQNCVSEARHNESTSTPITTPILSGGLTGDLLKQHFEGGKTHSDAYGDIAINFNGLENGMEFLSVAAGVTAKDKRIKDAKNQAAAHKDNKELFPNLSKFMVLEDFLTSSNSSSVTSNVQLIHPDYPDILISSDTTISQLLATLQTKGHSLSTPCISLTLVPASKVNTEENDDSSKVKAVNMEPLSSPLQRFSSRGGLSLLALYLPTVYTDSAARKSQNPIPEKEKSPPMTDWVKLEPNDDIYEDLEDSLTEPTSKHVVITSVPQHSLAAFGLFLRLPAYSDVLLRDKLKAQCLLRLVLGVTGDGEGNDIYSLCLAPSLPTMPFEVFRQLLDGCPLTTDDGMLLRRMVIEVGAMHLLLNCLGVFTHQSPNYQLISPQTEVVLSYSCLRTRTRLINNFDQVSNGGLKNSVSNVDDASLPTSDDKSHIYWAKGTGFGTGSTTQSWNVEQALLRQKSEEEHVTVLLQVLSSYVNPGDRIPTSLLVEEIMPPQEINELGGELPNQFLQLLQQSCLIPALSSYLRNDSVLDITRHIPLYRAILQLLRALSLSQQLTSLLQPQPSKSSPSIAELLVNMKTCVDTYAKRLKLNKKSNIKGQTQQVTVNIDDGDDEGLALLIPDIQETTALVQKATNVIGPMEGHSRSADKDGRILSNGRSLQSQSVEERYLEVMKKLQFDTYDMIVEAENSGYRFTVSHHFEKMVRLAGDRYHPSRVKRLAQEAVTLSTSLPLSFSSSVFVRCDTDRLDVMKVLITGPADTPYANGCFEFDVFFPPDYPNQPMQINLETTGRHSVRFNPNLYNDGKVCLSVLNTWHGRPEEKWNAQTSSFLQVLVSIQSLILVPEPYFNEPGFERSRGTPSGTHSSREYNSNIYQACVRWAMLEQIRNPSPCFKDVIHTHFWLKRNEICTQIENWIEELSKPQYSERNSRTISFNSMVLRRQYRHLREELAKLTIPDGLEDLDSPFNPNVTLPTMGENTAGGNSNSDIIVTESTIVNTPTAVSNGSNNNNESDSLEKIITSAISDDSVSSMPSQSSAPVNGTTKGTTVDEPSSSDIAEINEDSYDFEEAVENCKYWW
ncbi:dual E2 ubiquitin-conjugating enzyme/E3 ubiquitin-protein ligase BIRC6-like isoform 3-T4 [Glossina fuscipes fuscipes]